MKEKMEFYCIKPSLKQIYGRKVTNDLEFDEYTEDKTVHQIMKNRVLTTEIKKEAEDLGCKIKEDSKIEVEYPEGTILLWDETSGYIMPNVQVCTLDEVKKDIEELKEIYK